MMSESFYIDISKINIAHEFVLNNNNRCEYPNGRKCYGIIYCIDGEAAYRFASKSCFTLKKGNVLFLSPNAAYSISTKGECRHYTINFEDHREFSNPSFLAEDFYLLDTANTELYYHLFKKAVARWNVKNIGFEMQALAALYELLATFASEIYEKDYSPGSCLRLRPAREYIEHNFKKYINLDMLANLADMSVTNFRREWAKYYDESALQYRDRIRLSYAKEYLNSGYYTVSEVAEKCGFGDVNYFIRFFKKHMGVPPGKFRSI